MKIRINPVFKRRSGFTLIEMIGVLAVIAILAAVLIPKVFEAINAARVNAAVMAVGTEKTAVVDHYRKFQTLDCDGTATPPVNLTAAQRLRYDLVLLKEGLTEKDFAPKLADAPLANGTTTRIELRAITAGANDTVVQPGNAAWDLDGDGTSDTIGGKDAALAVLTGLSLNDALEIDRIIDGITVAADAASGATGNSGTKGRVIYLEGAAFDGEVEVYLTHR